MKVWWCFRHGAQVIAVTTKFPKPDIPKCCWYRSEAEDDSRDVGPCGDFREMELHPAGSRVVTADALVIEKVDGEWPEWAEGNAAEAISYDAPNTAGREVLDWMLRMDALAQSKEGE